MPDQSVTSRARTAALGALVLVASLLVFGGTASAQTFNATNETSFESALAMANSAGGANTIVLAGANYSPAHTLDVTSGTLTIQGPVQDPTVQVVPAKFSGGAIVPVGAIIFAVHSGVTVNFNDIQVAGAGSSGNAIIDDSGIANVNRSTINGVGPSLDVQNGGVATVANSTMGDGLDVGIIDTGTLTLINSTVTRNLNGGIDNTAGVLNLVNSIVAKNNNPTSADCFAAATTSNHSLDGDGTCVLDATPSKGNISKTDPKLGPLQIHGGATSGDFPASTSPAIDAGDPAAGVCLATDTRGALRPDTSSTNCDMGSIETYYGVAPKLTNKDITVGSTDPTGTVANYTPTWQAGSPVTGVSCSPASGTKFAPGPTTVTCTGTDSVYGTSGMGTFVVHDVQGAPPVVTTSGDQTIPATDAGGAIATFTASATATGGGTVTTTCVPASGTKFPVGATLVTCSASDSNGTGTKTLTITVTAFVPPSPPTFVVPANISVNATSAAGAVVTYTAPTATDPAGAPADPVTCTHNSGETFPIGLTNVDCQATTRAGTAGTAHFTVTVAGGAPPVITVPADISVAATMPGGAQVTYTVTATDPVDGTVPVTCTPASGATFSIATTKVNCTATDHNGNTGTNSFLVTVTQSAPPTVAAPANIKTAATTNAGAKVSFTVQATDPVDGALTPVCTPASGASFPIGTTTVNCSATNRANLATTVSFTVTVAAPTGPVITVPPFRVLGALTSAGDPVSYTVTAADQIDKTVPVTCTPASGATFPIGTTTVNCTATDSGGRTATASFDIEIDPPEATVVDNTFTLPKPKSKGDVLTVKLDLPGAGHIVTTESLKQTVRGKVKYIRFSRVSSKVNGGPKTVRLKPSRAGLGLLNALAKSQHVTVTVTVKFTPTGGKPHSEHAKVKLAGLKP